MVKVLRSETLLKGMNMLKLALTKEGLFLVLILFFALFPCYSSPFFLTKR